MEENGIKDHNGDVDHNAYNTLDAAFKELGGYDFLKDVGALTDLRSFDIASKEIRKNGTKREKQALDIIRDMLDVSAENLVIRADDHIDLVTFEAHNDIVTASNKLNDVRNVMDLKNLMDGNETGFNELVNFSAEADNMNAADLRTPESMEFIASQTPETINSLLKESGWNQAQISNFAPKIEVSNIFAENAREKGLKIGSDERKAWWSEQLEISDLYGKKGSLEEQLKNRPENLKQFDSTIEEKIEKLDKEIATKQAKIDAIEEKAAAEAKAAGEELKKIAKEEAGKHLEIYSTQKEFLESVEKAYDDGQIDKSTYLQLKEGVRLEDKELKEFETIEAEIKRLSDDPKANAKKIKELEKRQDELIRTATNIYVKGAHITKDGVKVNLINWEVVEKLKSWTDAQHENLHHYFNDQFKKLNIIDNKEKKQEFIQGFKDMLPDGVRQIVEKRLEKMAAYQEDGNTIEWLNVFAESLIKGELDYTFKDIERLEKHLENYLRKETPAKDIDFTPEEALRFIFDYAADARGGTVNSKVAKIIAGQEVELTDNVERQLSEVAKDFGEQKKDLIEDQRESMKGLDQSSSSFKEDFLAKNGVSYEDYMDTYKLKLNQINRSLANIGVEKTTESGEIIEYNEKYLGLRIKNMENAAIIQDPNASTSEKNAAKTRILEDNKKTIEFYYNQFKDFGNMDRADFESIVKIKALKALDSYDPKKGTTIHTHMRNHLKHAFKDAIRILEGKNPREIVRAGSDITLEDMIAYGSSGTAGGGTFNPEAPAQVSTRLLKEDLNITPEVDTKVNDAIISYVDNIKIRKRKVTKEDLTKGKPFISFNDVGKVVGKDVAKILAENNPGMATYDNPPPKGSEKQILRDQFLKDNWRELYAMMPENLNAWGDATGVANSLLKNFYETGERISQVESGSGVGTKKQKKREIDFNSAMDRDDFIQSLSGPERNNNTLFNALMREVAKSYGNQAFREQLKTNPEFKRKIEEKFGEDVLEMFKEQQFIDNILWGVKSGMSETVLDGKVLFSEVEKGLMESLDSKMEDLNMDWHEMNAAIGKVQRGDIKGMKPEVRDAVYNWLDETRYAVQSAEASTRFTGRVKKELVTDENIQNYADQSGLSFKEAKEVFDLIMGKGSMKGTKDGKVVWDAERLKYFEKGQQEFATAVLEQFPEILNITTGNKGNEVLKSLFGIHAGVSGKAGSKKGGADLSWWNPESYRGKDAKEIEWLSQETKDYLKDIDFDKITIQNIDALGRIKSAIMGTPKGKIPITQLEKIENLRKQLDPEAQKNLTAFYKFIHSARIDYYESKQGKGLEENKKSSTYLYQLEQGNTNMVFGAGRGFNVGKYFHLTEGRQDMSMENPIYKEYYDEGLAMFSDYGPSAKVKYGTGEYANKYEFAEKWAKKYARIKGEHLFAASDRSFEFLKSMFEGTGKKDLKNLDFKENRQTIWN